MKQKVLFIDRDGTLVEEPADNQVDAISKVVLMRGVIPSLLRLQQAGYRLVMVSNQDGLGTASFPEEEFKPAHEFILDLFESQGIEFDEIFICPHLPSDNCDCRKPRTGLLEKAAAELNLDLSRSFLVGDRWSDIRCGAGAGCSSVLVLTGYGRGDNKYIGPGQDVQPDHVAEDLAGAVQWIAKQIGEQEVSG